MTRTMKILALAATAAAILAPVSAWAKCGGNGGNRTKVLTCPAGKNIIGITVRGGAFVNSIGIKCGIVTRNRTTTSIGGTMTGGPGGGTTTRSARCPNGMAMNDIIWRSGALVDAVVGYKCVSRRNVGDFNRYGVQNDPERGIEVGGPGGSRCGVGAADGEALYRLRIKYGAVVDSVDGDSRR